ncbi:hypothetical protein GCM10018779_07020 [Streptomyces griseocarneus]|nr:hypothetical protein GCM10018779_07020 [Streptomyces griseocarneus]
MWEVDGADRLELTSGGRRPPLAALDAADPLAGLPKEDFNLVSRDPELAARIAGSLLLRFFEPLPAGLLDALSLTDLLAGRIDASLRPRVGGG